MSNWDRFASWDDNAPQENNIDMQFNDIKKNLSNTYARDDINDKLNQRGYTPCSYPMNINKSENNNNYKDEYNKYFGRLDYESSFKKVNNTMNKNEKNQINEHQFFTNRTDFQYNTLPSSISSRNLNNKNSNEINNSKNQNIDRSIMDNANIT